MYGKKKLTLEGVRERLYERLNSGYTTLTPLDIEAHAKNVYRILELKEKHDVIMLGHNYMEPLVFELSDPEERGDSLGLSIMASKTDKKHIIFNGVVFMAETAKILNPAARVYIADKRAGCSLADNFSGEDVRRLREEYPGVPVMIYINSYAEAKAESDVCCTSTNAMEVARKMEGDRLIFVPDILFAQNVEEELKGEKEILYPGKGGKGRGAVCIVHEKFSLDDIYGIRDSFDMPKGHPSRMIYAHWECRPEVKKEADFYGSTGQIRKDIAKRAGEGRLDRAFIASECELTSNLANEFPSVHFGTACTVRCPHMARISIGGVLEILETMDKGGDMGKYEIKLSEDVMERARRPIERMVEILPS